jgi:tetratricopeptide (TPR) repeat protein/tRNA A-37 threonylcarbamoyl transferase component Bud32
MTTPDPKTVETILERAWQIPPAGREAFVRAEAAGDEGIITAVLERLGTGASGGAGGVDLDATIDLPPELDLEATIDLPGTEETASESANSPEIEAGDLDGTIIDEASARSGSFKNVPDQIADFRLIEILGTGGMGEVYLAEQRNPKRKVALKVIRSAIATSESRKRFEIEAHTLARLSHPGIAQVFSAGVHDDMGGGLPFFAMEYVADASELTQWVDDQGMDERARLRLFREVCDGVAHGHQRGVMHLDLKPGNILVNGEGQAKVIDFGVAQMENEGGDSAQRRRQIVGTLQYMAPEQVKGDADMDISCDVYALGIVLYQLLTNELPYVIDTSSINAATTSVLTAKTPSLLAVRPDLGRDLDAIISKALAKEPQDRYRSASDLGDDIGRFLEDDPITAREQTAGEMVRRFMRKYRAAATAIVSIALVVLVGLVSVSIFAYRTENARSEEQRQRLIADHALEQANEERKRLLKITLFQEQMIKNIEPERMGQSLRDALLGGMGDRLRLAGRDEDEVLARIAQQEQLLMQANPTDIAVELIDIHILRQALDSAPDWFEGEPALEADLREIVADAYEQIGLYNEASVLYEQALEIRTRIFGTDDVRTLESTSDLGQLRLDQGRLVESRELLEATLEGRRRLLGAEYPSTIAAMQNLGMVYLREGDPAAAESVWKEALELSERVNGIDHAVTANLVSNFGSLYLELGRLDEAQVFLEKDAAYSERMNGALHPHSLEAMLNLGVLAFRQGELEKAIAVFQQVLEGYRRSLGDQHPQTVLSMVNLGSLLLQQGRAGEAAELLEIAYRSRREGLGDEHPDTFLALQLVAEAYLFNGDMSGASAYVDSTAERFLDMHGLADPRSVTWQFRLGLVRMDAKQYPLAEQIFLDLREACTGSEDLALQPACQNLPNVLSDLYLGWHELEPGSGHDASAAQWKTIADG